MSLARELTANWEHLSGLLDDVLLLSPAEKTAYLKALSDRNPSLAAILTELLDIERALPETFLEHGPIMDMTVAPLAARHVGDEVGQYRLLRDLGSGGMGAVWLAEKSDGSLKRKVALKLPRMPWIEGLTVQFLAERDILCSLEHPNIARLYDAGLDANGQPFIAMEYVEGAPINEHCDRLHLSSSSRVRLFLEVLDAVQYAHTRLVIHRDLKPANILINERGNAQLLDFGIAQLQPPVSIAGAAPASGDSKDLHAHTLRYASPEQLRRERLTVASDIYSLAVTLYELLTGFSPYGSAAGTREHLREAVLTGKIISTRDIRLEQQICTQRNNTLKGLRKVLSGDISAILQKALSLEPAQRYVSVEAFAADLRRWLELRPVLAIPPSPWYLFAKFLQRNPWPAAITGVSVIATSTLVTLALVNADRARTESMRATATKDFLLGIFDAANPERNFGKEISAKELLVLAEQDLQKSFSDQKEIKSRLFVSLADLWVRMGDLDRSKFSLYQVLSLNTEDDIYYLALIDLVHIYLSEGKLTDAERIFRKINEKKLTNINEDVLFEIKWYTAWMLSLNNQSKKSEKIFTELYQLGIKNKSSAQKSWALYGRSVSNIYLGKIERSNQDAREALEILKNSRMNQDEMFRRRLELLSVIYRNDQSDEVREEINSLLVEISRSFSTSSDVYRSAFAFKTDRSLSSGAEK